MPPDAHIADRRPIDPPPVVQLRVIEKVAPASSSAQSPNTSTNQSSPNADNNTNNSNSGTSYSQSFLQNPYYFMYASLASPDRDEELHLLKDGKTRCTTGSVVSSLYHLKDPEADGECGFFFFFVTFLLFSGLWVIIPVGCIGEFHTLMQA